MLLARDGRPDGLFDDMAGTCRTLACRLNELNAAYNGDDFRRDNYVCRRDASYVVDGAVKYDRTLYQMCMESKGHR